MPHLIAVFKDLLAHRELHERIARLLESLAQTRISVVDAETDFATKLRTRLDRAMTDLYALSDELSPAEIDARIEAIADWLRGPEWTDADRVAVQLQEKLQSEREEVRDFVNRIGVWQELATELNKAVNRARLAKVPVWRESETVRQLGDVANQAARELNEKKYVELEETLDRLDGFRDTTKTITKQLDEKEAKFKPYTKQANLLLLHSAGRDDEGDEYRVMFRTPSEPGMQGITTWESSRLKMTDRAGWIEELKGVAQLVTQGLVRHSATSQAVDQAAAAQAPPPADGEVRKMTALGTSSPVVSPFGLNDLIRRIGSRMYKLIIPEYLQEFIRLKPFSLSIATNDLELPWELMYSGENFLCLDRPMARMPMGQAYPRDPRRRFSVRPSKARFLLVYSDPEGNLALAKKEVLQIADGLRRDRKDQVEIEVIDGESTKATCQKLDDVLDAGTYDVIHYAGHASFNDQNPELSGLLLHRLGGAKNGQEVCHAPRIRRMLEGQPLVFLNACESSRTANETTAQEVTSYLQRPAEGLASAFVYGGARGCIGTLWPVYDGPAADFAIAFYLEVLEGSTIGEALRKAREESRKKYSNHITWASYVLYGDPSAHLFD